MKHTPLFDEQLKLNGRMIEFGGWEMPVQFSSIINEHNAVRQNVGMFDASHMGEFIVSGKNAAKFLDKVTVADASGLIQPGKAKYSMLLNEHGGVIDDIIIYRRANDYFVVVNAGNVDKDFKWLQENLIDDIHPVREGENSSIITNGNTSQSKDNKRSVFVTEALSNGVKLENVSGKFGLLAIQGPKAQSIMQELVNDNLSALKYFNFLEPSWKNIKPEYSILARTGYTGEDGFEVFITVDALNDLWNKLIGMGVTPCGLGARDTLRLEACMPLHGHEISDDITPLEAELDWAIFWDKEFIGKDALFKQKRTGPSRYLVAFEMKEGIPRSGCEIVSNGKTIGKVVSGTFSPTLRKGIGLGYTSVPVKIGESFAIIIHGQPKPAVAVKKPFYKKQK